MIPKCLVPYRSAMYPHRTPNTAADSAITVYPKEVSARLHPKSADNGLSIYDHFGDPEMEEKFVHIMRRAVKKDSMYSWSRSIVNKKDENPFWDTYQSKIYILILES